MLRHPRDINETVSLREIDQKKLRKENQNLLKTFSIHYICFLQHVTILLTTF